MGRQQRIEGPSYLSVQVRVRIRFKNHIEIAPLRQSSNIGKVKLVEGVNSMGEGVNSMGEGSFEYNMGDASRGSTTTYEALWC